MPSNNNGMHTTMVDKPPGLTGEKKDSQLELFEIYQM